MPLKVHAVVQESEHINDLAPLIAASTEHDEVPAFAPVAGDMQRPDTAADFRPILDTDDRGPRTQGLQRGPKCAGVSAGLRRTEVLDRPAQNLTVIRRGGSRQANHPERRFHYAPITAEASVAKC